MTFRWPDGVEKEEVCYKCIGCSRIYEPSLGYFDLDRFKNRDNQRQVPVCADHGQVMRITEVLSDGKARFACPTCACERTAAL